MGCDRETHTGKPASVRRLAGSRGGSSGGSLLAAGLTWNSGLKPLQATVIFKAFFTFQSCGEKMNPAH